MNIALFFGSFNPIHIGHLIIANTVVEKSEIDQLWFVVSPQNPFKKLNQLLDARLRIDMVNLCIGHDDRFRASDIELSLPVPSYTIDTLAILKEKYPKDDFTLLMGSDNLTHLHKWKNAEVLLTNHDIIVFPRPGDVIENTKISYDRIQILEVPMMEVSSTYIRKEIKAGRSVKYLLPDTVLAHIEDMMYYK